MTAVQRRSIAENLTLPEAIERERTARDDALADYQRQRAEALASRDSLAPRVKDHVQAMGVMLRAWRGTAQRLGELVAASMDVVVSDEILTILRREDTQLDLLQHRETALWLARAWPRGEQFEFRLVNLSLPTDAEAIRTKLAHHAGRGCRWCLLEDHPEQLHEEIDLNRRPITGSFLHEHCGRAWHALRSLEG